MNKLGIILIKSLKASFGLVIFAFGLYLTVQADIGLAPWDVFAMGVVNYIPMTFGQATMVIGIIIVVIDLILHEKIGIGTVLDAIIVGSTFDLFDALEIIPKSDNIISGLLLMTVGLFIMAYSQYIYMGASIGCGPRDSFLVAIGKRMKKLPIGAVSITIEVGVLMAGWLLGGSIGIGTAYSAFGVGVAIQIVFKIVKFEPRDVSHEGLRESLGSLVKA